LFIALPGRLRGVGFGWIELDLVEVFRTLRTAMRDVGVLERVDGKFTPSKAAKIPALHERKRGVRQGRLAALARHRRRDALHGVAMRI
jgi:hypothetical protein